MKLKILFIIAFIALNLFVYFYTSSNVQSRIEKALEYHSTKLDSNYNTYKFEQALTSKNLLSFIETFLIDDLKKIDGATESELIDLRKNIIQKITPIYTRLKNKGLFQVQFVLPNNRSFLRVHKPNMFGDDLSEVRYSFKYVNETKKPIEGFEAGKTKYGYRYVYPLYDEQGNYLCAVETSFSTDHLQEYFTNIMNLHTHYLIEKEVFNFHKWKPNEKELSYKKSAENSDYMLVVTKRHTIQNCITNNSKELLSYKDEIINKMKIEKPFNLYVKLNNNNYNIFDKSVKENSFESVKVLSFKPINSVHGKVLSWIVSYEEDPFIASTLENATKIRIVLFILFLFVFYFIYRTLNQQQQLKKLQSDLTKSNETLEASLKDVQYISMEQKTLLSLFDKGESVLFKWNNDETWSVDFVSQSVEKLLGYDTQEFIKNKIQYSSLIHPDDIDKLVSEVEDAMKNEVNFFRHEPYRVKVKSGEYKWLLDNTVVQKDENGNITHFIGYISDISKEKNLEKKLIDINEHLQEKVEKAVIESRQKDTLLIQQSKMASMGEMIGNIAHQWRQPLNALGLTVQKIKMYHEEDMLTEKEIDKAVDKSKKLIEKMSATIDDFRNFFKVDKVARKFIVNEAIDSTLELLEGSFKNNNIAVHKEEQNENIELLGHKNELEQVILNLINNAKDALIENKIEKPKIEIKLESKPQEIIVSIIDNAGGVPINIIDKIFDPYFTTKEQGKGTGIGLYMSKMIVETNMNGKIEVENINDGASFTIKIPKESIDV